MVDPSLLPRSGPGRPRLTSTQSGLLKAIVSVVTADENMVAADPRRRSEQLRSYMRLDDLWKELKAQGFNISRSATHLKLLPPRSNSIEGKRNVEKLPLHTCRAITTHYEKRKSSTCEHSSTQRKGTTQQPYNTRTTILCTYL